MPILCVMKLTSHGFAAPAANAAPAAEPVVIQEISAYSAVFATAP